MHPLILSIALLPLLFRLLPFIVPAHYLESYNYWSTKEFNRLPGSGADSGDGIVRQWRNMGYWEATDVYPEAAEALARKLLGLANAEVGGSVLDVAHGAGESLALHLSQTPPPASLHALTSLPSETIQAKSLVASRFPHLEHNAATQIKWYTMSAGYKAGKDTGHPLNPMAGYLGEEGSRSRKNEDDNEDESEGDDSDQAAFSTATRRGYDLVYILDAIYHFPPSVPHFLASVLPNLKPGTGVVAYTDVLPPSDLSAIMGHLVIPPLVGMPARNLVQRPKDLVEYKELLERIGYTDIVIEDWSAGVWPGFARFLRKQGMGWDLVGRLVEGGNKSGWKFVGVRARRP